MTGVEEKGLDQVRMSETEVVTHIGVPLCSGGAEGSAESLDMGYPRRRDTGMTPHAVLMDGGRP